VVPAYNTPLKYFRPLVESVSYQTYDNWELIIVDASDNTEATTMIREISNSDKRIKVIKTRIKVFPRIRTLV
jgi:glycosyltransferase involved in cell wall biosynthesis